MPNPTFISMEDEVAVLGYAVDKLEARTGDQIKVTIYWKALEAMGEDYSVFVQFLDHDGHKVAQLDTYPAMGIYPTSRWRANEVARDSYPLRPPRDLSMPVKCQIIAGMYHLSARDRLEAFDAQGNELDLTSVGHIVLRPINPLEAPLEAKLSQPIEFAGEISLVGSEVQKARHSLNFILWWRSRVKVTRHYTDFVHMCREDGGNSGAR